MPLAVRNYDPTQNRDPDGTWGDGLPGADLPGLDLEDYARHYDVYDESATESGLTVVSMTNGEMQFAYDDPDHPDRRQPLVDLTEKDVLDLRWTLQRALATDVQDEWELTEADEVWLRISALENTISIEVPGDDFDIEVGFDEAQSLIDALDEQLARVDELAAAEADNSIVDTLTPSDVQRVRSQESGPAYTAPAGPPVGGQFAKGGGRVGAKGKQRTQRRPAAGGARKPTGPPPNLSFDGNTGTGYGIKGGDPRVRTLQSALNRLGLTDASGAALVLDGKYGPRTTASVKKLQKALGVTADGKVTPELLKQISGMKQLPAKATTPRAARKPRARSAPTKRSLALAQVRRALGEPEHVLDEHGTCATCWTDQIDALSTALSELTASRSWDAAAHPRNVKGAPGGGRFRSNVDKLKDALKAHKDSKGSGDPFEGFDREQLRRVAKARGIPLDRGEGRESIAKKLTAHLDDGTPPKTEAAPKAPARPARAPRKKAEPKVVPEVKPEPKPAPKKRAPRKAAAEPATSPAAPPVKGRDLIGSPGLVADVNASAPSFHSRAKHLAAIAHLQGFDAKTAVVSQRELDKLVAGGGRELFRGVEDRPGLTAAQINEQFRSGEMYYGTGMYGWGVYAGARDHAEDFAQDYGRGHNSIVRMALKPDAQVVKYDDLYDEWAAYRSQFPPGSDEYAFWNDLSRFGAARGYDAVDVTVEGSVVILNRTALVFQEADK